MEFIYEGDVMPPIDWPSVIKATIDKAVMEERKRCASFAMAVMNSPDSYNWGWDAAKEILEKIEGGDAD